MRETSSESTTPVNIEGRELPKLHEKYHGQTQNVAQIIEDLNKLSNDAGDISGIVDLVKERSNLLSDVPFKRLQKDKSIDAQQFVQESKQYFDDSKLFKKQNYEELAEYCHSQISACIGTKANNDEEYNKISNKMYVYNLLFRWCEWNSRSNVFKKIMDHDCEEGYVIALFIADIMDKCFVQKVKQDGFDLLDWRRGEVHLDAASSRKRKSHNNNAVSYKCDGLLRIKEDKIYELVIHEAKKESQNEHFTMEEDYTKLKKCTKDALVEIVNSKDIQTKDICVFGIQTIGNKIYIFKNVIEVSDAVFWYKIAEFDIKSEFSTANMEQLIKLARIMLAIKQKSIDIAQMIKKASKRNEKSLPGMVPTRTPHKDANNNNNNDNDNDNNSKDKNKKSSNNNLKNNQNKEKFSNMKNNLFGFNFRQKLSSEEYQKIYSNERNSRNIDFAIRKSDQKKVVIKKFEYEDLKNGMEELSILLQLQQYDFVVKILDCFKPEMENWTIVDLAIVFERLEALPHPSKMSIAKLKNMAKQLLQALEILHEKQKTDSHGYQTK